MTYAGWSTRQANLERHVRDDGRLDAEFHRVDGSVATGLIERLPVPTRVRGNVRVTLQARPLARLPRPDVIWTSGRELLLPYLWAFTGRLRRPLVVELDWTLRQQEEMAPWYYDRPARSGPSLALALARQGAVFSRVDLFTPMSRWAADGLREAGVPEDRIRVLHPGLDLTQWEHRRRTRCPTDPLRLLFVGGDFRRKGGDLLVDAVTGPFADQVVADVVTRDRVPNRRGVTVHRCEPNSDELRALYARADLFVMPTRAECFGHAVVEAMASGLPVIVGDVGGLKDIVEPGSTGWRIAPDHAGLAAALADALHDPERLPAMGVRARRVAEERFDGRRNDRTLVDAMLDLVQARAVDRRRADRRSSTSS